MEPMSFRVQARDLSMNISATYDTEDSEEAILAAQELAARRPDLIIEVVPIVGPHA
jgi:hypothetical protein